MSDPAAHPELAAFPVVVALDVAWGEMDSFAHVNNAVYFRYFENARVAYLDRVGWFALMKSAGLGPIVSAANARFRKPVAYPDRLLVGARVTDVQPDRVVMEHKLVSTKWGAVACEGLATVVSYDYRAAAKCPLPDAIRAVIAALEALGG